MIQEKTAKKAPCGPNEEINEPLILDDFPMDAIQFYNCYGQHMVNREEEPGCCGCGGTLRKTWDGRVIDRSISLPFRFPESNSSGYQSRFCCTGFCYPQSRIAAVLFVDNNVGIYEVNQAQAVISFRFSGCYMAKFTYDNRIFVCHITSKGSLTERGDCREGWDSFVRNNRQKISDMVVFKPVTIRSDLYAQFQKLGDRKYTICGLITPNNSCYALLMDVYTCQVHSTLIESGSKLSNGLISE